ARQPHTGRHVRTGLGAGIVAASSHDRPAAGFAEGGRARLAASGLPGVLQPGNGLVDPEVAIRPAELRVALLWPQLGGLPQSLWLFHLAALRSNLASTGHLH